MSLLNNVFFKSQLSFILGISDRNRQLEILTMNRIGENMKKKQPLFIILLATFAGLAGGFISNQIFQTKSAFAEKKPSHQKVVIAEEFRVVDKGGIKTEWNR
jgi:hypothetical protein